MNRLKWHLYEERRTGYQNTGWLIDNLDNIIDLADKIISN